MAPAARGRCPAVTSGPPHPPPSGGAPLPSFLPLTGQQETHPAHPGGAPAGRAAPPASGLQPCGLPLSAGSAAPHPHPRLAPWRGAHCRPPSPRARAVRAPRVTNSGGAPPAPRGGRGGVAAHLAALRRLSPRAGHVLQPVAPRRHAWNTVEHHHHPPAHATAYASACNRTPESNPKTPAENPKITPTCRATGVALAAVRRSTAHRTTARQREKPRRAKNAPKPAQNGTKRNRKEPQKAV